MGCVHFWCFFYQEISFFSPTLGFQINCQILTFTRFAELPLSRTRVTFKTVVQIKGLSMPLGHACNIHYTLTVHQCFNWSVSNCFISIRHSTVKRIMRMARPLRGTAWLVSIVETNAPKLANTALTIKCKPFPPTQIDPSLSLNFTCLQERHEKKR